MTAPAASYSPSSRVSCRWPPERAVPTAKPMCGCGWPSKRRAPRICPRDRIESAIRRGAGQDKDAADIEEILYEGYAPHGIAILLECLTDNRNRTIAEVRRCFSRANGNLSEPGSVAWQFTAKGYVAINLQGQ